MAVSPGGFFVVARRADEDFGCDVLRQEQVFEAIGIPAVVFLGVEINRLADLAFVGGALHAVGSLG